MASVAGVEPVATAPRNPSIPLARRRSAVTAGVAAALLLTLSACGGDDDEAGDSTTTTIVDPADTTSTAPTTTAAAAESTTTTAPTAGLTLVTEGATVVVANASGVEGGAGRMSEALAAAGFTMGTATNSSESQLSTTKIYYDAANAQAQAVAESVKSAFGGGDIEVLELPDPAPLSDPATLGEAGVLVAMGNDVAAQGLDELQGGVADESSDEASSDESSSEATADEASADG